MKQIKLGKKNVFAIIDDEDFKKVKQFSWFCNEWGYALYRGGNPKKNIRMHRLILDAPKNLEVDHINGNKLDNRRENLRLATKSQNQWNRNKTKITVSKFKGVFKSKNRWQVKIKQIYIGSFKTEHQAALAYDLWARDLFGEFAGTNF